MKTTADTSVLVASFASWHEHHDVAFAALANIDSVIAHCLLETFSVLTRLPAPHRMPADVVATFLDQTFAKHPIVVLPSVEQRKLVTTLTSQRLSGGAVYDALIAASCVHAGLKLLTLDGRARQTYALLGAEHALLT